MEKADRTSLDQDNVETPIIYLDWHTYTSSIKERKTLKVLDTVFEKKNNNAFNSY